MTMPFCQWGWILHASSFFKIKMKEFFKKSFLPLPLALKVVQNIFSKIIFYILIDCLTMQQKMGKKSLLHKIFRKKHESKWEKKPIFKMLPDSCPESRLTISFRSFQRGTVHILRSHYCKNTYKLSKLEVWKKFCCSAGVESHAGSLFSIPCYLMEAKDPERVRTLNQDL